MLPALSESNGAVKSDVEMLYTDSNGEHQSMEAGRGSVAFEENNMKTDSITAGVNGSVYEFAEIVSEVSHEEPRSLHAHLGKQESWH